MAVTAYAAKGDEERIRDAGAEGYVSKPISVLKFVEAVRALLDAAATRVAEETAPEPEGEGEPAGEAGASETQEAAEPEGEAAPEEPSGEEEAGEPTPDPI